MRAYLTAEIKFVFVCTIIPKLKLATGRSVTLLLTNTLMYRVWNENMLNCMFVQNKRSQNTKKEK